MVVTLNKPICIFTGNADPNTVNAIQEMVRKMRESHMFIKTPVVIMPTDLTEMFTNTKFLRQYADSLEAVVLDLIREGKGVG